MKKILMPVASVYSPFSDMVGFPLHNIPSVRVLMRSIGAEFLRPDAPYGVNPKYYILAGTQIIQL